ncbi:PAAR domain-containing protein [Collimonas arenae]|nr:PAAR domain-containing protein [Collimonas arenae]
MVMRKIVVVGDKTTTAGVILPNANSTFSVGDASHKVALIGGQATCLACKGVGVIAKAGGPRRMNFMGEVALENDIVICGCPVHPKLVANLRQTMTYDDQAEALGNVAIPAAAGMIASSQVGESPAHANVSRPDEQVRAVDAKTGDPIADLAYYIEAPDGSTHNGYTDSAGLCDRLTTFQPQELKVWFGEDAEEKMRSA